MSCNNCKNAKELGFKFCPQCGECVENADVQNEKIKKPYAIVRPKPENENSVNSEQSPVEQSVQQPIQQPIQQPAYYQQNYQPICNEPYPYGYAQYSQYPQGGKVALAPLLGFIFSLVGIVFLPIFFSVPGLILGIIGLVKTKTYNPMIYSKGLNKAFSIVAVIASSIIIVLMCVVILCVLIAASSQSYYY